MAKFVFIYHGGMAGATKEEQDKNMAEWGAWFEKLGASLVDGGNPFGPSKVVMSSGVSDAPGNHAASGYSIVNADSHDAAVEMAKGCPILSQSEAGVEVCEAMPM